MLRYLKEASPWLRFVGILGFISCGFIALGAFFTIVGTITAAAFMREFIPMGEFLTYPIWLISPMYIAIGVLCFFPSLFTYNFGAKIRRYQLSNSDEDLEQAFKNNKSFWKFYGILCIIYLAFIPVMMILSILISVIAAAGSMI